MKYEVKKQNKAARFAYLSHCISNMTSILYILPLNAMKHLEKELSDLSDNVHEIVMEYMRIWKAPDFSDARIQEIRKRKVDICNILHTQRKHLKNIHEEEE